MVVGRRTDFRTNKKFHYICKRNVKASGQHLNTLFDKAIRIGTRIRNSSGISRGGNFSWFYGSKTSRRKY